MSEAAKKEEFSAAALTLEPQTKSLLDAAVEETTKQSPRGTALVDELIKRIGKGTLSYDKNLIKSITREVARLDQALSAQLAEIMHHPDFQKLEGTWRGLHHLVDSSETCGTLKIKMLNISKRELFKDLDTAIEFDQSHTFKHIYEHEFGTPGGEPYGALIGDYEFENHPEDIALLTKMSQTAAAAMCPFISATSPKLFGFKSYTELSGPRDLARIFEGVEYTQWKAFRESADARYVGLVMPRVLARLPYGDNTKKVDEFRYEEVGLNKDGTTATAVNHDHYCWMNAAYVYASRLTAAFSRTNWTTAIVGRENGGSIEGLPAHVFENDQGDKKVKCPTEIAITDRRDAELSKLGFMPLCWYKNTTYAVFFDSQSVQKPKQYVSAKDNANSELSAMLPYIFASSRIGHYLKMIARDKLGSFMEATDCQAWLEKWISQYVLADANPKPEMKARFPLAEFKVVVKDNPRKPGCYNAQILMRPWLMLKELTSSLSMVAEIPKS